MKYVVITLTSIALITIVVLLTIEYKQEKKGQTIIENVSTETISINSDSGNDTVIKNVDKKSSITVNTNGKNTSVTVENVNDSSITIK